MTTQYMRYSTSFNDLKMPVNIRHKIGYPTVYQQADDLGGQFFRINRGLPAENVANFSPCILFKEGHRLIAWRSQPESFVFDANQKYFYYNNTPTEVYVGELIAYDTIAGAHKLRGSKPHRLSYEDPRLFIGPDNLVYCQFVTSSYATCYDQSHHLFVKDPKVCVGVLDDFGEAQECIWPEVGVNHAPGKTEKNWCFFTKENELKLLYATVPLVIKCPGKDDVMIDSDCLKKLTGDCATFNSTAPIDIGDEYLVFYHWKYMAYDTALQRAYLLYHTAAYTLDKELTAIQRMSTEALFSGSTHDELVWWTDALGTPLSTQPACILPFGGEYVEEEDCIELALGVNDSFMGVFKCPLAHILATMDKV